MYLLHVLVILAGTALGGASAQGQANSVISQQVVSQMQATPALLITTDADNDDDTLGTIHSTSIKAKLMGVDMDVLTAEQEVYLEDALGFAYNQVHKNTDKKMISNHLIGKMVDKDGDSDDLGSDKLGGVGRRPYNKRKFFWPSNSWYTGCYLYEGGYRRLTPVESMLSADTLEAVRIKERWEAVFCKTLVDSGYEVFEEAHDCQFTITHNDHIEDPDLLAAAQVQSPVWRAKMY